MPRLASGMIGTAVNMLVLGRDAERHRQVEPLEGAGMGVGQAGQQGQPGALEDADLPEPAVKVRADSGFLVAAVTPELMDAWVHMLRLMHQPQDIAALVQVPGVARWPDYIVNSDI